MTRLFVPLLLVIVLVKVGDHNVICIENGETRLEYVVWLVM